MSGCYYVTSDPETKLFIRCHQRVSFFYRLFGDRLKVVHMHLSHPYEVTDPDEYFPFRFGKEAYEYIASTHQLAFTDSLRNWATATPMKPICLSFPGVCRK